MITREELDDLLESGDIRRDEMLIAVFLILTGAIVTLNVIEIKRRHRRLREIARQAEIINERLKRINDKMEG